MSCLGYFELSFFVHCHLEFVYGNRFHQDYCYFNDHLIHQWDSNSITCCLLTKYHSSLLPFFTYHLQVWFLKLIQNHSFKLVSVSYDLYYWILSQLNFYAVALFFYQMKEVYRAESHFNCLDHLLSWLIESGLISVTIHAFFQPVFLLIYFKLLSILGFLGFTSYYSCKTYLAKVFYLL